MSDRREYQHQYYLEHRDKRKADYQAYKCHVKYVEVKRMLFRVKKDIGEIHYNLLMDELEKLEKVSLYGREERIWVKNQRTKAKSEVLQEEPQEVT